MVETIRVSGRPVKIEILSRDYWGYKNYRAVLPAGVRCHEAHEVPLEPLPSELPALMQGWHRSYEAAVACAELRARRDG
jgi:hypothetical protein